MFAYETRLKNRIQDDAEAGGKFIDTSMSNLHIATTVNESITTADLVLEAVVENIGLKQKLFKVRCPVHLLSQFYRVFRKETPLS